MATAIDEKNLPKLREYLASQNFTDKYFQLSRLINKFDSIVDIKVTILIRNFNNSFLAKPFSTEDPL